MRELVLDRVQFSYQVQDARVRALRDISLTLRPGNSYLLCGQSGSGKSTLGLLLAGLLPPEHGSLRWTPAAAGEPVTAYVFQFPEQLFFCDSVRDEFREVARRDDWSSLQPLLARFGLNDEHLLAQHPYLLSMGYARLTAIALQAAREPDLLIMDEPTIGLDDHHTRIVTTFLQSWPTADRILITITHDLDLIRAIGGTCLILRDGALVWSGPHTELLNQPDQLLQFGLSV